MNSTTEYLGGINMPITVLGEPLYSLKETAAMLEITPRTMHSYVAQGKIIGQKIGGAWRFTEASIKEYISGKPPAQEAQDTGHAH